MYGEYAGLFAFLIQVINGFHSRLAYGTHSDYDALCVFCAVVVKEMMLATGDFRHLSHSFFNEVGNGVVIFIGNFAALEVDVGVLRGAADNGMIGVKSATTELFNGIPIQNFCEIRIINDFDLLNFVGSAETVKEVDERNTTLNSDQVSDSRQIHNFLNAGFAEHGATALTTRHNVLMIAEDVQVVGSKRARADMENAGE